jgi:4-hydroxybenzoate polyprenyltransferase
MQVIRRYASLVTFSHTVFAMPFALIGFGLGIREVMSRGAITDLKSAGMKLFLIILCMVFARNAAMAFNRYLDRGFDALNPRTAIREIPMGILKGKSVLIFVLFNVLAFMIATWFINTLCFYLAPVALFVILFYSFTKRFTSLCHLVLGLGLSLAPIGAYLAVTGSFSLIPLIFSAVVVSWVAGFDIIYALQDEQFDREHDLHSIPALLGKPLALRVSSLLHVVSAVSLILAGWYGKAGMFYWIGATLFSVMLIYQHRVVKPNDLSRVNIAFMTANGIASVIFSAFVLLDIFIH